MKYVNVKRCKSVFQFYFAFLNPYLTWKYVCYSEFDLQYVTNVLLWYVSPPRSLSSRALFEATKTDDDRLKSWKWWIGHPSGTWSSAGTACTATLENSGVFVNYNAFYDD